LTPPLPEFLDGVRQLAARFEGFIVDQWGVLHDGTTPYPGAQDALARLRASGKRIVILSNSGKRAVPNAALMAKIGFASDLYDAMISAGEDAHQQLKVRCDPFYAALGRRCVALMRPADAILFDGLDLDIVERLEDADFVFLIALDPARTQIGHYEELLREAVARGLPMVCANPDLVRAGPHGLSPAPGMVARRYEELGGKVRYHGKPHPPIYRTCLEAFGGIDHGRVVAVGDSIEHDVAGAAGAGVASALIAGGIHAAQLGIAHGQAPSRDAVAALLATAPARPSFVVPAFVW
jgi:HAD superfamily hydrolase (TIGR01459 family)